MNKLGTAGYKPIRFCDVSEDIILPAIIRHDVDMDLQEAVKMAEIENEIGIRSTFFVLLTSEYYNLLSGKNTNSVKKILELGHEIGLHFDITAYEKDMPLSRLAVSISRRISMI